MESSFKIANSNLCEKRIYRLYTILSGFAPMVSSKNIALPNYFYEITFPCYHSDFLRLSAAISYSAFLSLGLDHLGSSNTFSRKAAQEIWSLLCISFFSIYTSFWSFLVHFKLFLFKGAHKIVKTSLKFPHFLTTIFCLTCKHL